MPFYSFSSALMNSTCISVPNVFFYAETTHKEMERKLRRNALSSVHWMNSTHNAVDNIKSKIEEQENEGTKTNCTQRICVCISRKRITKRKEKIRRYGWKLEKLSARWCKTCIDSVDFSVKKYGNEVTVYR